MLAAIFAGDTVHVIRAEKLNTMQVDAAPLPDQLGNWHKVRQWDDRLVTGWIVYTWAEYQSPDLAQKVALGVSPRLSQHDAEICHLARGEDPTARPPRHPHAAGRGRGQRGHVQQRRAAVAGGRLGLPERPL
ncbi:hypothetical protein ACFQBQ_13260 [Granulicella cerasi]|uniref:Uncharacterized protein n=1 Tax=Granulicella cerasi TaxID=741063 RepID=A0ABW1ZEB8_9BACT